MSELEKEKTTKKPKLRINSWGLLSKWGFNDGDLIEDWVTENFYIYDSESNKEIHLIDEKLFDSIVESSSELLNLIIYKFLIPEIKKHHKIEIKRFLSHNSLRIRVLDGKSIDWYEVSNSKYSMINPRDIEIPNKKVLKFCKKTLKQYKIIDKYYLTERERIKKYNNGLFEERLKKEIQKLNKKIKKSKNQLWIDTYKFQIELFEEKLKKGSE